MWRRHCLQLAITRPQSGNQKREYEKSGGTKSAFDDLIMYLESSGQQSEVRRKGEVNRPAVLCSDRSIVHSIVFEAAQNAGVKVQCVSLQSKVKN